MTPAEAKMTRLRFLSLLAVLLLACAVALAQVLSRSELRSDVQLMPGERVLRQTVEIASSVKLDAVVEITPKGNGTLTIGNLMLRVLDEQDDGAVYQDGMATVEFADIDGDGYKDLVVVGAANYTDEKTGAIQKREPFAFVFKYDPKSGSFYQSYKRASFTLEKGPQAQ